MVNAQKSLGQSLSQKLGKNLSQSLNQKSGPKINKTLSVLVIGGAGYIGSHVVKALAESGARVFVYDNLSTGKKENVLRGIPIYAASILNKTKLAEAFAKAKPDAVVHLAAEKSVGKSMTDAISFSETNVTGTINILRAMQEHKTRHLVFSSSAAVFGSPQYLPIDEEHPTVPINYYGATKKIMEEIMHWYDAVYGIKYAALRYFNAAGHTPDTDITVIEKNPQNLIPVILETAQGTRKKLQIFGRHYATPDGTCIRDYVHVSDLADAHVLAIAYLRTKNASSVFNLGTGKGFSVKQVYDIACAVTGISIPMEYAPARAGDPAALYAKSARAQKLLGWAPRYGKAEDIVAHSWQSYLRAAEKQKKSGGKIVVKATKKTSAKPDAKTAKKISGKPTGKTAK